jgi:hypothetical protein
MMAGVREADSHDVIGTMAAEADTLTGRHLTACIS